MQKNRKMHENVTMDLLNYYTFNKEIETYKLHAKLLELLDKNNFSLRESIKENFGK